MISFLQPAPPRAVGLHHPIDWCYLASRCNPKAPIYRTSDQVNKAVRPDHKIIVVANEFWALGPQPWPGAPIEMLFQWARAANSAAKLIYNDYGPHNLIRWFGTPGAPGIIDYWARARDWGCPVTGIGVQAHYSVDSWDGGTALERVCRKIREAGLEVHFPECTVWIKFRCRDDRTWEQQAAVYREMAELAISYNAAQFGITAPWDKYPWCWDYQFQAIEAPGLWDTEGNPKPAFYALQKLGLF